MKLILIAFAFMYNCLAFSADVIVQYKMSGGFVQNPSLLTVSLLSDGTIVKEIQSPQSSVKLSKEIVAKISGSALLNVQREINRIPYKTPLVDLDAKKPKCLDAPTSQIAIVNNGQSLVTYLRSSCHTSSLQYGIADSLNTVMLGFAILAN